MKPTFDERDEKIRRAKLLAYYEEPGVRVGDWIVFADGIERRVSYVWPHGVQTSAEGSFYFGNGYQTFSGSLFRTVPTESLTATGDHRDGLVWFFHHDYPQAHSAVETIVPQRVFRCSLSAPP